VAVAATYSGGGAGHVDGADAPGGRGACLDGGHDRCGPSLWRRRQPKR
jgi:hypothetical protein